MIEFVDPEIEALQEQIASGSATAWSIIAGALPACGWTTLTSALPGQLRLIWRVGFVVLALIAYLPFHLITTARRRPLALDAPAI